MAEAKEAIFEGVRTSSSYFEDLLPELQRLENLLERYG
jgi:hypothetical protein